MKRTMLLFFVVCILVLLPGCSRTKEVEPGAVKSAVTVKLTTVTRGSIDLCVTVTGKTDAARHEKLISPVAGKIVAMNYVPTARVKAGEVLARIRTKESDAAVAGAQMFLRSAATTEQKNEAEQMLQLAEKSQHVVDVQASIGGIIVSRSANTGEFVAENSELYTIVDLSSLSFIADAPLASVQSFRSGQRGKLFFDALPDTFFPVAIENIGAEADSQSQNVKILMKFLSPLAGAAQLKTAMPGVARITIGTHENVFLVNKMALLRNDETNTNSLVIITADSLSKTLEVTVGATNDSLCEISGSGLTEGMAAITQGNYGLADSTRITVASQVNQ